MSLETTGVPYLESKEDRGSQEERRLPHSLGGVNLGGPLAGGIAQQGHPQVQGDVIGGGDLIGA